MLAGDEQAYEQFFDACFPGLYRFALVRLGQDEDDAEEVAQAAICKALLKLATYRGEAALFTWLCTFCRHEISAMLRGKRRAPRLVEETPEVRAALETLSAISIEGPESVARRNEIARLVQVTLDRLPLHYGNALEWKYVEGLSVKEIAARLGVGPKAVESMLTRARVAFRDGFSALVRGAGAFPARSTP